MRIKLRKVGTSWGILIPKDIVGPFMDSGFIDVEFPHDVAFEKNNPEILKPEEKKEKLDALRELITMVENKPVEKVEPVVYPTKQYKAYDPRYNPNTGFNEDSIDISEVNEEFLN